MFLALVSGVTCTHVLLHSFHYIRKSAFHSRVEKCVHILLETRWLEWRKKTNSDLFFSSFWFCTTLLERFQNERDLYQKSSETPDKIGKDLLALEGEKSLLSNREIKRRVKCQIHRALYILHISATSYSPLGRQIRLNGGQEPHSVNWILCFPFLLHISSCRSC